VLDSLNSIVVSVLAHASFSWDSSVLSTWLVESWGDLVGVGQCGMLWVAGLVSLEQTIPCSRWTSSGGPMLTGWCLGLSLFVFNKLSGCFPLGSVRSKGTGMDFYMGWVGKTEHTVGKVM